MHSRKKTFCTYLQVDVNFAGKGQKLEGRGNRTPYRKWNIYHLHFNPDIFRVLLQFLNASNEVSLPRTRISKEEKPEKSKSGKKKRY
jgi:hypothetical protein